MSTLKNKVSLQIDSQLPEFVQAENPNFVAFMKAYYEFMESAELKLTTLGSIDAILSEAQPVDASSSNFIIFEDTNRYRPGQKDKILLQDTTTGAFVNTETIRGQTSQATAVIRVEDINDNSRLFISSQNDFIIGEQVVGETSNASGIISNYTANPVQNIQQLLEYADVDQTIDQFFDEFKEAFLKTIPKGLTAGVNEKTILKNIKDLYRSKGTKKGHELFFRILLNEEATLSYPRKDMLRVSDGDWLEDTILRVTPGDDTILMEDASAGSDIFILLEDGGQIKTEISLPGTSDLLKLVGQEITQAAVVDLSILAGGAYYGLGYSVINVATALVDKVTAYTIASETVYELILSKDSVVGTFVHGQTVTAEANDDADVTLYAKMVAIITDYNAATSTSSQYYDIDDPLTVTADNGGDGSVKIDSLTSGEILSVIVDAGGSAYEIGDTVTVNNANTNGTQLAAQISVVNGGIAPESGTVLGQVDVGGEFGVIVYENGSDSNTGITYNERVGQEWGTIYDQNPSSTPWPPADSDIILEDGFNLLAENDVGFNSIITENSKSATDWSLREHIISETYDSQIDAEGHIDLENFTVFDDGIMGQLIVQESGTGSGDVTDIVVTQDGYGYTKTPLLTLPTTGSRTGGTIFAKGSGDVGSIRDITIIDAGAFYTAPITIGALTNFLCTNISGTFTLNETVTGGTSGATGIYKETDAARNIIKLSNVTGTFVGGDNKSGETITGGDSGITAIIDSYDPVSLSGTQGTVGTTSGKFLNEDGFIDEKTKKIQDSYYWQDFSYVVRTSSSINQWRDQIIASVHPAGWQVFGQVDIATAVQSIANITSIIGLGGLFKVIYSQLIGRRLGTTDQGTISTTPDVAVSDPSTPTPALEVLGSGTFTNGQVITGGTSNATGLVFSDGSVGANRLIYFTSLSGIFEVNETISSGAVTATVYKVFGLLGQRDLTLTRHIEIIFPPSSMSGQRYGFAPAYRDIDNWKWVQSQVESATSTRTFGSMDVYPVYLNMVTTITSGLDASTTTIPVAATDNLPTAGTIKLGTEEITYTGRSTSSGAGNLTGGTRGANSTSAASHLSGANLTLVRNAVKLKNGWRIDDLALFDDQLTPITIARVMQGYANDNTSWLGSPKNPRCIDSEITVGKT